MRAVAQPGRLGGPDVTRAVALVGVVIMNYHGYLNGPEASAGAGATFGQRLFDPAEGVLSTRFAATFVVVAGIGITLLTRRSRSGGEPELIRADRWRLIRRGVLLYLFGLVLDWVWPGTILFFYGAMFVVGALVFHLRTRWVVALGAAAALAGAGIAWWGAERRADGRPADWLFRPETLPTTSPRGLLFDTFVNGTHPLLPWLAFLCAGIVLGRMLPALPVRHVVAAGAALLAISYVIASNAGDGGPVRSTVLSTRPFDRGLLYTAGTLGSSLVAVALLSAIADRWAATAPVEVLRRAGRSSLSLYVLHVFVYRFVVDTHRWVGPTGLDTALVLAGAFSIVAVALAAVWLSFTPLGPVEVLYRRFGG